MSPSEKTRLTVLVLLSSPMVVRRRLHVLGRYVPRPTAAGSDEVYMGTHSFNILEMP